MTAYLFRCCGQVAAVDNSTAPTLVLPHVCNQGNPGQAPIVQVGICDAQNLSTSPQVDTIAETNVNTETVTVEPPQ